MYFFLSFQPVWILIFLFLLYALYMLPKIIRQRMNGWMNETVKISLSVVAGDVVQ